MGHYTHICIQRDTHTHMYIYHSAFSNEFQIHTPPTQMGFFSLHCTHTAPSECGLEIPLGSARQEQISTF